jgi:predicted short-subunit dehydrogenase-like oxidoreductase (DUF2520 family)
MLGIIMDNTSSVALGRVTIIGAGRVGRALARALSDTGVAVRGPLRRGEWEREISDAGVVLLCVPDGEIASVAQQLPPTSTLGHCAGALTLDVLAPHAAFSMHPLLAITGDETVFRGAAAAIAGNSSNTLTIARALAIQLGMTPIEIADADRTLYHACAVIASNYLVALEETAAKVGASVGVERHHLVRLAESALANWSRDGARSLTGPVVRGDEAVVACQRDEIARSHPDLLPFWDALTARTREIAAEARR